MQTQTLRLDQITTAHQENHRITLDDEATRALAADIKRNGLLSPIRVLHRDQAYQLIYGHRRLAAVALLDWSEIATFIEVDPNTKTAAIRAAENLTQERLSPVEEAIAITQWINAEELSVSDLATLMHRTTPWVQSRVDIATYPPDLQEHLHSGDLSIASARELALITDDEPRVHMLSYILKTGANAGVVKGWVTQWHADKEDPAYDPTQTPDPDRAYAPVIPMTICFMCREATRLAESSQLAFCPPCLATIREAQDAQRVSQYPPAAPPPVHHTAHTVQSTLPPDALPPPVAPPGTASTAPDPPATASPASASPLSTSQTGPTI